MIMESGNEMEPVVQETGDQELIWGVTEAWPDLGAHNHSYHRSRAGALRALANTVSEYNAEAHDGFVFGVSVRRAEFVFVSEDEATLQTEGSAGGDNRPRLFVQKLTLEP